MKAQIDTREGVIHRATEPSEREVEEFWRNRILAKRPEKSLRVRLVQPAHDAETDVQIALLHETGNDGVERTLARSEKVGARRVEHEAGTAILERKAVAGNDHARAEGARQALDHRDDVAVAIDDGEITRVSGVGRRDCRAARRNVLSSDRPCAHARRRRPSR